MERKFAHSTIKFSKEKVSFEHPARGPHHCGQCEHYLKNDRCAIVEGVIRPEDWCKKYEPNGR